MSIYQWAADDLPDIIENLDASGVEVFLISPQQIKKPFTGLVGDIALMYDPDTGEPVSGRSVKLTLIIKSIYDAGFKLPRGIGKKQSKPWLVYYTDRNGLEHKMKVKSSAPSTMHGVIDLTLEVYKGAC